MAAAAIDGDGFTPLHAVALNARLDGGGGRGLALAFVEALLQAHQTGPAQRRKREEIALLPPNDGGKASSV